ncbi:DUF2892 domain-containing protein [Candidatus Marithioploca araucensis]|uniref:DUF2892 domain-containing protein n=1 Tax=Candidatus Marithioploca araucensis TaxID=70273 RepID=A0ABT7VRV2_9GAMM|nr:DUF2892 domain-containing protein [Candidatus Marithioploca araucensis]
MKANIGIVDKALRAIIGLAIITAGFYFQTWWGAIGVIPLLTAMIGYCPAYSIIGFSSCAVKTEEPETK